MPPPSLSTTTMVRSTPRRAQRRAGRWCRGGRRRRRRGATVGRAAGQRHARPRWTPRRRCRWRRGWRARPHPRAGPAVPLEVANRHRRRHHERCAPSGRAAPPWPGRLPARWLDVRATAASRADGRAGCRRRCRTDRPRALGADARRRSGANRGPRSTDGLDDVGGHRPGSSHAAVGIDQSSRRVGDAGDAWPSHPAAAPSSRRRAQADDHLGRAVGRVRYPQQRVGVRRPRPGGDPARRTRGRRAPASRAAVRPAARRPRRSTGCPAHRRRSPARPRRRRRG